STLTFPGSIFNFSLSTSRASNLFTTSTSLVGNSPCAKPVFEANRNSMKRNTFPDKLRFEIIVLNICDIVSEYFKKVGPPLRPGLTIIDFHNPVPVHWYWMVFQ